MHINIIGNIRSLYEHTLETPFKMFMRLGKQVFIIILLCLFVKYFALPSLERFYAKETIFTETEAPFDESSTPAVSIRITNAPWQYVFLMK